MTWGVPELIVAFGQFSNEDADRNYQEWKALPTDARREAERPQPYVVRFYDGE